MAAPLPSRCPNVSGWSSSNTHGTSSRCRPDDHGAILGRPRARRCSDTASVGALLTAAAAATHSLRLLRRRNGSGAHTATVRQAPGPTELLDYAALVFPLTASTPLDRQSSRSSTASIFAGFTPEERLPDPSSAYTLRMTRALSGGGDDGEDLRDEAGRFAARDCR